MRSIVLLSLLLLVGCKKSGPAEIKALNTEDEKTFYALGLMLGRNIQVFKLNPKELAVVQKGISDTVTGQKPMVELAAYAPKVQALAQQRMSEETKDVKEKADAFLAKAATEPNVQKAESGLLFTELTAGTGESPKASDRVKVHYKGTLPDGTEFDSSHSRGQPAEFALSGVIPCWTEGVQKMKPGGKAKLICPSSIAYGERGSPPKIPGGAALIFEIELLEVLK